MTVAHSKTYSINAVSKMTGISVDSLRNWERRFEFLRPIRGSNGRRLYREEDIRLLQKIGGMLKAGAQISDLANLIKTENFLGLPQTAEETVFSPEIDSYIIELRRALRRFDYGRADFLRSVLACTFTPEQMITQVYGPMLKMATRAHEKDALSGCEQRAVSAYARMRLWTMMAIPNPASEDKTRFVVAAPLGELYEGDLLIVSTLLKLRGRSVIYLGANISYDELAAADAALNRIVFYMSCSRPEDAREIYRRMRGFRHQVFVGGLVVERMKNTESIRGNVKVIKEQSADAVETILRWTSQ